MHKTPTSYHFQYKNFIWILMLVFCSLEAYSQSISNEGSEFWLCFPSHVPSTANGNVPASLSVFITSKSNTSGKISCGSFSQNFSVAANQVTEVIVPRTESYINDGTGISTNKGIYIKIDDGKPKAVVYGHIFAGARSAATLVLPTLALGQKYYAIAYTQQNDVSNINNARSQFQIVCTEPNTTVKITPRLNGNKQNTFNITLANVGDVYQYQSQQDISGSLIEVDQTTSGCKKFAIFSGSSALGILGPMCSPPGGTTGTSVSFDPLFQQLYPLESWGTQFAKIPFAERNRGSIYRIMASQDGTVVSVDGNSINLNAGEFYEVNPSTTISLITANKAISVSQYALTQYCADSKNQNSSSAAPSDPDMVILNPLEYSIKNVTMYSSVKLDITDQFLNIMIPTTGVASFKINGTDYSNRFSPVPGNTKYSYAQINLGQIGGSNFNLTSNEGFTAVAYGFGNYESYAYSAGTNLASSVFINAVRKSTQEVITSACKDEPFDFRLVLPYISTKLVWNLEAGDNLITQNNPQYTQITLNGKTLYEYRLPVDKVYSTIGTKAIKILSSFPPTSNGCPNGDENLIFDFEIYDPPANISFKAPTESCVGEPIQFTFNDVASAIPIRNYFWDFGDGQLSEVKNPIHTYTAAGDKVVKLYVKNDVACLSNVITVPLKIYNKPTVNFDAKNVFCTTDEISFNNLTQLNGNSVQAYEWDFGDGNVSSSVSPKHRYSTAGTFQVRLKLITNSGCELATIKSVSVFEKPTVSFEDPQACVTDVAQFNAITSIPNIQSYQWNFGDGTFDPQEDIKKNPVHKFTSSGNYLVKVKVITTDGCENELSKTITINGANPIAKFEVLDSESLCSIAPVFFKDFSGIAFGKITKLEWIYNYKVNGENIKEVVLNPASGAVYSHKYPSSATNTTYQVLLRAFSGELCFQEFGPVTINVIGSPKVKFDEVPTICENENAFKITQASEIAGLSGKGVFSGKGVTDDGWFDPKASGTGLFEITYTFYASEGCADSAKRIIKVAKLPDLEAGDEKKILFGGQTILNAVASPNIQTYQWLPTTGLSNPNILNPIASPREDITYTLTVTSTDGCTKTDQISVKVIGFPKIPDTFTPNGDGTNDTWNILYLETYMNAKINVFNRYGNLVHSTVGYNTPWDGKSNGKDLPVGVYYYVIDPQNEVKPFTGSITIIR